MKWRFRLDQSRAIFGLVTFAALLASDYIRYVPFLDRENFLHILAFTAMVLIIFIIGGYLYDRVLKLWTETQTVNVERNPYTWVPGPKEEILWLGWFAYIFKSLNQIATKMDVELEGEGVVKKHMKEYYSLNPNTPNFEQEALKIRELSRILERAFIEMDEEKKEE